MKNSRKHKNQGISLVEVMVGVFILTIGLIPIVTLIADASNGITKRQNQIKAVMYGQDLIQTIKSRRWDENTNNPKRYVDENQRSKIDREANEKLEDINTLNDIDDFDGYEDFPIPKFKRSVKVFYVNSDFGKAAKQTNEKTDYKMVEVTVEIDGKDEKHVMRTIVINGNRE